MPKKTKAVFLIACGCSIATSTMVSEILREDLERQRKYNVVFHHCKTSELLTQVDMLHPDIVITTAPVDKEWIAKWNDDGVHYFKGTPFLTGVGEEPIMKEVLRLLDEWGVKK
jgi:galactitol-specific phosphotransferase system IIB component